MAIPAPFGNDTVVEPEGLFDIRRATDLSRPALHLVPEAATGSALASTWYRVEVQRPSIFKPRQGAHYAQYTPWAPDDDTVARGEYYEAPGGACYLFGRGTWWVRLPQAGAAAALYPMILLDAISVAATGLQTAEAGLADQLIPAPPASALVALGVTVLLPPDATRKQVFIKNMSVVAGTIVSVSLNFGSVLGAGVSLFPGDAAVFGLNEAFPQFAAIASVAATPVSIQTWN